MVNPESLKEAVSKLNIDYENNSKPNQLVWGNVGIFLWDEWGNGAHAHATGKDFYAIYESFSPEDK